MRQQKRLQPFLYRLLKMIGGAIEVLMGEKQLCSSQVHLRPMQPIQWVERLTLRHQRLHLPQNL